MPATQRRRSDDVSHAALLSVVFFKEKMEVIYQFVFFLIASNSQLV
jgi:hypothetical protein